ncbi:MAG: C-type lectin domain-containing protein [Proteobacteria bacterium]|nr:C-type lectin domain-containing protein [Pseudomonadota bacterium]
MVRLKKFSSLCLIAVIALACFHIRVDPAYAKVAATEEEGWIMNPANGHYYKLTTPMNWLQAETQAMEWGEHLVTINDREEELWLRDQFGANEFFWIGLNDINVEGNFEWVSGEPVTYTNWWEGEPNNQSGNNREEDAVVMNWGGSELINDQWVLYFGDGWNDGEMDANLRGIVEISSLCDFSTEPDIKIQRCFGGIGTQCEGNAPGTPFTKDEDTCLVYGWMSVGSILHDRCCYETNNAGYWCPGPMQGDPNLCADEWAEAKFNTWCTRIGAPRQWQYTFGPYPAGNTGDDTSQDLRAPVGARVNPEYQYLCPSGSGRCKNAKGRPLWDICGFYCECQ